MDGSRNTKERLLEDAVARLTIQLFGSFEIRRDEQVLPRLRSRTGQWLLTLLLLRAGREVEREWLAGTLWPESTGSGALANLRRTLTDLRHLLQEEAICLSAPSLHTLRLDLPPDQCDLLAFDQALKRKDTASLEWAVSLYRGPLLEGSLEEWLLPEREAREHAYLGALETLAEECSPARAADYLREVVRRDPARESAQCRLMSALAAAGDYAEVTQAYRRFRLFLHGEAQGEPTPETTALYRRLCAEAKQPRTLRDTARPLSDAPRRHFSRPMTSLIGRDKEIARITALLSVTRMVTLIGAGGIGKTRLALHLADHLADHFTAGVWFVDLAPLSDPALVPRTVRETLRLPAAPGDASDTEALVEFISHKPILLILDNCEHLAPACAGLAEALQGACPHLRLLATSRQPLGLAGEHLQTVFPLLPADAAQLFAARGSEGLPGFCLTAENAEAVAAVCRRLDGIPLALEMAAARLRAMSVTQIAARLEDGFPRLTGTHRKALPRQRTLRATMDWSYSLLSSSEQELLGRLSVFAGGWTLEAAEQVCAPSQEQADQFGGVSDLLLSLVDQSLVVYSHEGSGHYRFLEPIRQYAAEKLQESGEAAELRRRHLRYFLKLAEDAQPHLEGPAQAQWHAMLQGEHDNLRAALVFCQADDCDPELGLRLFAALIRYWLVQGHLSEGRQHGLALLACITPEHSSQTVARALLSAGHLAFWQGDLGEAEMRYAKSLEVSRVIGDEQRTAWSLSRLGCVAFVQRNLEAAQCFFEESLTLERHPDNDWVISESLNMLGAVALQQGKHDTAWRLCQEGLALRRALRDDHFITASLTTTARVALARGDYNSVRELLQECFVILRELGDRTALANALELAGMLTLAEDRLLPPDKFIRAARHFGAAAALRETVASQISPIRRVTHEQRIRKVRDELGQAAFTAAWDEGKGMTLMQNIAFALEGVTSA